MADLRRNQREFQRVAKKLAPDRSPEQVLQDLGADHPPPAELLQAFRNTFGDLRGFIAGRTRYASCSAAERMPRDGRTTPSR